MYPNSTFPASRPSIENPTPFPLALGARVANIVLTSQVQMAYACAMDACRRAQRASACVAQSWPDTPLRSLLIDLYGAQEHAAQELAGNVLARARRNCGLAYARF